MALPLSEKQLAKLNKKDILGLLLGSIKNEEALHRELTTLTEELKRTNQQMQVLVE